MSATPCSRRPLFDFHPSFEVCGEAEHGREAVEKAPNLCPDLIVLDLSMPAIRQRAYELCVQRARGHGHAVNDWLG
jgi:DNA-binding NarL/FixJ family response regulator